MATEPFSTIRAHEDKKRSSFSSLDEDLNPGMVSRYRIEIILNLPFSSSETGGYNGLWSWVRGRSHPPTSQNRRA